MFSSSSSFLPSFLPARLPPSLPPTFPPSFLSVFLLLRLENYHHKENCKANCTYPITFAPCRCLQKRSDPASHAALAVGQPGSHAWRRAAAGRALGGPAQRQRRSEAGSFGLSSETASWEMMPPSGSIFVQISIKMLEPIHTLQVEVTLRNQKKLLPFKNEQKILTVLVLSLTLVPKAGLQRGFRPF